jgi:hypothetical protein
MGWITIWDEENRRWLDAYALEFTGPQADISLIDGEPVHPRFRVMCTVTITPDNEDAETPVIDCSGFDAATIANA